MGYCTKCGSKLLDGAMFCQFCGSQVVVAQSSKPAPETAPEPISEPIVPEAAPVETPIIEDIAPAEPEPLAEKPAEPTPSVVPVPVIPVVEQAPVAPADNEVFVEEIHSAADLEPVEPLQMRQFNTPPQPASREFDVPPLQAQQVGYQAPAQEYPTQYQSDYQTQYQASIAPAAQLPTNRSLGKFFWLSLITFGIYGLIIMTNISTDINLIATRRDGKKTMHYCLVYFLFSWLTLGILPLVWYTKLSTRISNELRARGIVYSFSAKHFWLWNILGACIICGPFIYYHKLLTAMNLLSADYNARG